MLPMPVLDAKALDNDPKGMAFLVSVLRQRPVTQTASEEMTPPRKISRIVHMRFRLTRRSKELLPSPA